MGVSLLEIDTPNLHKVLGLQHRLAVPLSNIDLGGVEGHSYTVGVLVKP